MSVLGRAESLPVWVKANVIALEVGTGDAEATSVVPLHDRDVRVILRAIREEITGIYYTCSRPVATYHL